MEWKEFYERVMSFISRYPLGTSSSNPLWLEEAGQIEELALNQRDFESTDQTIEICKKLSSYDTQQQFLENAHDAGIGFTAGQVLMSFNITPGKFDPKSVNSIAEFEDDNFYNMIWDTLEYCVSEQVLEISLDYIPYPTREAVHNAAHRLIE